MFTLIGFTKLGDMNRPEKLNNHFTLSKTPYFNKDYSDSGKYPCCSRNPIFPEFGIAVGCVYTEEWI